MTAGGRPGRWRTGEQSRRRVLDAARRSFADRGYDRTTVRQVAADARVDPAMVHYFFGTKSRLFATAMALPADPAERLATVLSGPPDRLGERLVRHFLTVWDDVGTFEPMAALLRSAPTDDESAALLQQFIQRELLSRLGAALGGADAELRAELVGSQLVGLAFARYVLRMEPIASASVGEVAARAGAAMQTYFSS